MLNDMGIEKLYKKGLANSKQFRSLSDYIVEHYVYDIPNGKKLTEVSRAVISECSAIDMAIGSESSKNKYLITGILIGVATTGAILSIRKIIKSRKKKKA